MKINKYTLLTIFLLTFLVQLTIVTYNFVTGFIDVPNFGNYLIRLAIGTSISFVFALILVFIDIQIINGLDQYFPLPNRLISRIPVELLFTVIAGIIVGSSITVFADIIMPYDDGLEINLIKNSLITSVINLIIITVIEAIVWYKRSQQNLLKAERLEMENSRIRFETLKGQLNPHFLFNSLNVLSSLIKRDHEKAQNFIDEFSSVYRYALEVIEKPVVELREEIEFVKSFLYLQKIRFSSSVITIIEIDASKLNYFVPPLSVQTLVENAFKHNKISENNPLKVKIYNDENYLIVINNYQPKFKLAQSKGLGLSNLKKRYELLSGLPPVFSVTEEEYISKIPILKPE